MIVYLAYCGAGSPENKNELLGVFATEAGAIHELGERLKPWSYLEQRLTGVLIEDEDNPYCVRGPWDRKRGLVRLACEARIEIEFYKQDPRAQHEIKARLGGCGPFTPNIKKLEEVMTQRRDAMNRTQAKIDKHKEA